jgi:hypothetical protein
MKLIYQSSPAVNLASNVFVNVPVVLQFDETPLISVVSQQGLGYTTEVPIYRSHGTYLAKVNGTRVYPTDAGKSAGIRMRSLPNLTVCELEGRTLFEVHHQPGDAFRLEAELATPTGYFVKVSANPLPSLIRSDGQSLRVVGGLMMSGNVFNGGRIGILLKSDGSLALGCS